MKHLRIFSTVFCVLVSIFISNTASAQFNHSNQIGRGWTERSKEDKQDKKDVGQQARVIKIENLRNSGIWTEETKYYEDIRMDSLWYVGVGNPISADKATRMDKVYRLSMKLSNGKYIHVECLERGAQKPSEKFCSRLLPVEKYDYDIGADSTWVESEKFISQIYQYPSIDTNSKSMEIGCDKDGNTVHSASIEFMTDNRAIIIYNNSMGNMINLTASERYKAGTIVIVEFSKTGDPIYTVSDIGGWPIKIIQ